MEKDSGLLERVFHLSENGTSVKTEIMAGITTFMTMAYILAVNPSIMSTTGMDKGAVLTATAIAGFIGTILMAAFANYPFALAPGMGLNAFFAFTVVQQMGYTWEMALAAVFVEGMIFIILSLTNVREAIFNAIPLNLKRAVSAGIGLFIAFIGLCGAQIIVANPATKISLFSFKQAVRYLPDHRYHRGTGYPGRSFHRHPDGEASERKYPLGYSFHLDSGHSL